MENENVEGLREPCGRLRKGDKKKQKVRILKLIMHNTVVGVSRFP